MNTQSAFSAQANKRAFSFSFEVFVCKKRLTAIDPTIIWNTPVDADRRKLTTTVFVSKSSTQKLIPCCPPKMSDWLAWYHFLPNMFSIFHCSRFIFPYSLFFHCMKLPTTLSQKRNRRKSVFIISEFAVAIWELQNGSGWANSRRFRRPCVNPRVYGYYYNAGKFLWCKRLWYLTLFDENGSIIHFSKPH